MFELGLKLWSINKNYVAPARELYQQGYYQYIELFANPGSYDKYLTLWQKLKIPFLIHAPHYQYGLNLSQADHCAKNLELFKETKKFADALQAQTIIVHPGIDGHVQETCRQLKLINDPRIVIENKPYDVLNRTLICVGHSPEEIERIKLESGVGFCLDIGHAIVSANAQGKEPIDHLKRFLALKPSLIHLSNGTYQGLEDSHANLDQGDFPLKEILKLLPRNIKITIETIKASDKDLNDFKADIECFKNIVQS